MNQTFGPQIAASPNSRAVSAAALAALFFLSLLAAAHAQTNYQRLKSFGFPEFAGGGPSSALVEGNDGKLYGTDSGTAFTLNRDGSGYTVLHRFGSITGGGDLPNGLVEANGGLLFGTTRYGGSRDEGTIFMLNKDGTGYTVLHSFTKSGGRWAFSGLVAGIDGALYGTTSAGGSNDLGTVFKINPDGSGYVVLYSFKGGQDAAGPVSALGKGSSGTL